MIDQEIDDILRRAAVPEEVDPAVLQRIAASIRTDLHPVRAMPPVWLLRSVLFLICAAVALLGAARAGFIGLHNLSVPDRALIFPLLAVLIGVTAVDCVSEVIPGSRRFVSPALLLLAGTLSLLILFGSIFHDHGTKNFLSQGLDCLGTGLLHAIPTALASGLLLRRGLAVNPRAAGAVTGMLAGLAGLTVLELHCPDFQVLHVMIWHIAVVVISAAAGAWIGARINRAPNLSAPPKPR